MFFRTIGEYRPRDHSVLLSDLWNFGEKDKAHSLRWSVNADPGVLMH